MKKNDIKIVEGTNTELGRCSNCEYTEKEMKITEITLKDVTIRLCEPCKIKILRKMNIGVDSKRELL